MPVPASPAVRPPMDTRTNDDKFEEIVCISAAKSTGPTICLDELCPLVHAGNVDSAENSERYMHPWYGDVEPSGILFVRASPLSSKHHHSCRRSRAPKPAKPAMVTLGKLGVQR